MTGVNFFKRKFLLLQEPIVELIDVGNDEYVLRQTTTLKTSEAKFKPGVEFETEQLSPLEGKFRSTIIFVNANKLIQSNQDGPPIQITREFTEPYLIMVKITFW